MALFNQLATLNVSGASQTAFTLPEEPDQPTKTLLVYGNQIFPYGDNFVISGTSLNWSGTNTEIGEKLFLLYNKNTDDPLFNKSILVPTTSDGQTIFRLQEEPAGAIMIFLGLQVFITGDSNFSLDGQELTWAGVVLSRGDILTIVYRSEDA